MKISMVFLLVSAIATTGCSFKQANAGHEVVLIEKPWVFGHGGVDPEPVRAGMTITAVTTAVLGSDSALPRKSSNQPLPGARATV